MEMKFLHANYIRRQSMNGKSTHSWTERVRRIWQAKKKTKNGEGSAMIDEFVNSFRFIFIYCMRCRCYIFKVFVLLFFFFALSTEMLFNRKVLFLVLETTQKKIKLKLFMRIAIYHHLQS